MGRNLLDMDTFSKSDPGKWNILILQYTMKYKENKAHRPNMHSSSVSVNTVCCYCSVVMPFVKMPNKCLPSIKTANH